MIAVPAGRTPALRPADDSPDGLVDPAEDPTPSPTEPREPELEEDLYETREALADDEERRSDAEHRADAGDDDRTPVNRGAAPRPGANKDSLDPLLVVPLQFVLGFVVSSATAVAWPLAPLIVAGLQG